MKILSTTKIFSFLFLVITINIYSQGTLTGIVKDSLTNDPLVGANIYLEGTGLGAAVNIDGEYSVVKIPLGSYTVKFSYIGYKAKEITVNINSNKTVELNVQLTPDVLLGEEILISGQAEGQAAAINQQLSSNTIVNVVSEQRIQELPDANAAEAIGRLPGVSVLRSGGEAYQAVLRGLSAKYSTITIDGVRMASTDQNNQGVDLSTISQGSLAGIELYKALTPDKDADAIAGNINFVTKKAPSQRLVRIEAIGDYNKLDNSAKQYNFNGRYGERFFNGLFGLQVEGNLERRIRSNESTDYTYDFTLAGGNNYENTEFRVQYINEIRKRGGASILMDFNTPDGGSIKFNTVYNKTSRDYLTSFRNYILAGEVRYDYREQQEDIDIFNTSIHGDNNLFGLETDWNLSFAQSKRKTPYDYELYFTEPSGMNNIPASYNKGPVSAWIPYARNNFSTVAFLNQANDNLSNNLEKIKTGYLDLLRKYSLSSDITGSFKFGGKYRERNRSSNGAQSRSNYYLDTGIPPYTKLADGSIVRKDFTGTMFENTVLSGGKVVFSNFLDPSPVSRQVYDQFALNPLINLDAMKLWRELNINGYLSPNGDREYIPNVQEGAQDFYDLTERTLAGYVMNTLNIGHQITFIAGVRVESDDNDYSAQYMNVPLSGFPFPKSGTILDSTTNHTESTVLPNVQLIYRPFDFMNVRFASYKALARPDFNFRLPRLVAYQGSGANLRIGNPDLKNAVAWNFEIQTQLYSNTIGLFSISAFYKNIDNILQYINGPALPGPSQALFDSLGIYWKSPLNPITSYNFYYPYNSSRPTKVWGFEVEHQISFRYLPGFLKNIVLNYNFSIVRSETWAPTVKVILDTVQVGPIKVPTSYNQLIEKKQKLQDQPEFFGNISLGYDIFGFSFRIAGFYQGKYNSSFSGDGRSDQEADSFTRLDISLKQIITDNISILLNLNNITNTKEGTLYDNRVLNLEKPNTDHRYGMTADFGVRVEF